VFGCKNNKILEEEGEILKIVEEEEEEEEVGNKIVK